MFNVFRRDLLRVASTAVFQSQLSPGQLHTNLDRQIDPVYNAKTLDATIVRRIAETAVQTAMNAGATYCDVRLTFKEGGFVRASTPDFEQPRPSEEISIGIRSFYRSSWGFAGGTLWTEAEVIKLARESVLQASLNADIPIEDSLSELLGNSGNKSWSSIASDDPFDIPWERMYDFVRGIRTYIETTQEATAVGVVVEASFVRERRFFLSSTDHFTDQLLGFIRGNIGCQLRDKNLRWGGFSLAHTLTNALAGFNYIDRPTIRDEIDRAIEEAVRDIYLPVFPIEPGKLSVLLAPSSAAPLIYESIGLATEIDRVLGFESNSTGTSYITDQEIIDGKYKIGNKNLNVKCDRSFPQSAARVGWDDEGIKPMSLDLIREGVLVDVQRDVSGSEWCKRNLPNNNAGYSSSGAAVSVSAFHYPRVSCGHITLQGASDDDTLEDLRRQMDSGLELHNSIAHFDYTKSTGQLSGGILYRVKGGKKVEKLVNSAIIFRTSEVWNNLVALGAQSSVEYTSLSAKKGENNLDMQASVCTPPIVCKELSVIDITRKA